MGNKVDKSYRELQAEVRRQTGIIFPAAVVALWTGFGWRQKRVSDLLERVKDVLDELADDPQERSLIQVLDEETGIEMRLDGEKRTWREISYLNGRLWKRDKHRLNAAQIILANTNQKKYVAVNLLSAFCVALHRHFGFGYERLSRFIAAVDAIRHEHNNNAEAYTALFEQKTGMRIQSMPFYDGRGKKA